MIVQQHLHVILSRFQVFILILLLLNILAIFLEYCFVCLDLILRLFFSCAT